MHLPPRRMYFALEIVWELEKKNPKKSSDKYIMRMRSFIQKNSAQLLLELWELSAVGQDIIREDTTDRQGHI